MLKWNTKLAWYFFIYILDLFKYLHNNILTFFMYKKNIVTLYGIILYMKIRIEYSLNIMCFYKLLKKYINIEVLCDIHRGA